MLRAIKLNPSRENSYPASAVMVKINALPAAACVVGEEKNADAPLIWAALSKPEDEVNVLNDEAVETFETVIPVIGAAELASDSPVKLKVARVAP